MVFLHGELDEKIYMKQLEDFVFNRDGNLVNININGKELSYFIENSSAFLTSGWELS